MAVELRCPDCRAKLRLPSDPEPGTEVECPECGFVFAAPDPDTGEAPDRRGKKKPAGDKPAKKRPVDDEDEDRPVKKRKADEDEDEDRPAKKTDEEKPKEAKKPAGEQKSKKRRAKKKETNKAALTAIIVGVVVFLAVLIGLLVWFFNKKSAAHEMMTYLPDDSTTATGLNLGHMTKYSEFIKVVEPSYKDLGFKRAADALSKAIGGETNDLIDYMVIGSGKSGSALVLRTKKDFDTGVLAKLPGARQGNAGGQAYYTIAGIDRLWAGTAQEIRVFAPTSRLAVFCPLQVSDTTFQRMAGGNRDNFESTLAGRVGALGKRTMRGTFWHLWVFETNNRPTAPDKEKTQDATRGAFQVQAASSTGSAQGMGFKASLGSRAVRFEAIIWFKEAETASDLYKKYKENDLAKGDEVEPPKFWKDFADNVIGSKKVANELLSNLGAKSSGELFVIYSECDTKILMEVVAALATKLTGQTQSGSGGGMMGPPGGAGGPGGPMSPKQ